MKLCSYRSFLSIVHILHISLPEQLAQIPARAAAGDAVALVARIREHWSLN